MSNIISIVYNVLTRANCNSIDIGLHGFIRRISEYQREHNEASRDISKYISNPINAYLLTKRLTSDWKAVEQVMAHDVSSRK